jgi:hypothetical protein
MSYLRRTVGLGLAISALAGWSALTGRQSGGPELAAQASTNAAGNRDSSDAFVGMWNVTVIGTATYYYTYAISRGAFIATGNVDANWDGQGSSFGPTMGTYERVARRTYRIHELAWSFDPQGNHVGHSEFLGTYTVDESETGLTGDGTWTLYDLDENAIYVEPLTVTGTRVGA